MKPRRMSFRVLSVITTFMNNESRISDDFRVTRYANKYKDLAMTVQ